MTKAKVVTEIKRVLDTRLAGLRMEHEDALQGATPGTRLDLVESAFVIQEKAIKANLAEADEVASPSAKDKISHGSLARLRVTGTKRQSREWWLIARRLCQSVSSVAVEGERVLIHDGELGSKSLIGKSAGDQIERPFWHGDGRDNIVRIEVLKVY